MSKKNNVEISARHSPTLKPWAKLTQEHKRREIVRFAYEHRGRAVSLNLSPSFEAYLPGKDKPMRQVGKRMHAELNKLDLHRLPVLMVLEATRDGKRPHLHGVFIPNGVHDRTIQIAMRKAVGYIPGRSGSRQFHAKFLSNPAGWSNYLTKHTKFTRKLLLLADDQCLWWTSHSMTQVVRDNYEAVRLGKLTPANSALGPASHAVGPSDRT